MTRKRLQQMSNERRRFKATFGRRGTKPGWRCGDDPTILLKDVKTIEGRFVTGHLWFNMTKGFAQANLEPGDTVEFDARVKPYQKGYMGRRVDVYQSVTIDYKLSHPTKIVNKTKSDRAAQE